MTLQPGTERSARAFTLIELILVMAMLTIVTSLAAPSLTRFFRGRVLSSEARQLLSLTRAGQSRAVSAGFPMLLWFDAQRRTYGLQEEGTMLTGNAQDVDSKAQEFPFGDGLQIEPVEGSPFSINGQSLPAIRFLPDGSMDENSSLRVQLTGNDGAVLWLLQATNRLTYEIRNTDRW